MMADLSGTDTWIVFLGMAAWIATIVAMMRAKLRDEGYLENFFLSRAQRVGRKRRNRLAGLVARTPRESRGIEMAYSAPARRAEARLRSCAYCGVRDQGKATCPQCGGPSK